MIGLEQKLGIVTLLATTAVTYIEERAGRNNGSRTDPDGFIGYGNGSGRSFITDSVKILSRPEQEESQL